MTGIGSRPVGSPKGSSQGNGLYMLAGICDGTGRPCALDLCKFDHSRSLPWARAWSPRGWRSRGEDGLFDDDGTAPNDSGREFPPEEPSALGGEDMDPLCRGLMRRRCSLPSVGGERRMPPGISYPAAPWVATKRRIAS